jgi:threonyl-tRNA synthetase
MALLIEQYHSRWPFWLNPRQVIILTVNDEKHIVEFARYAARIIGGYDTQYTPEAFSEKEIKASQFHGPSILVDVDDSPRPLGKKLSEAKRRRYGVVAIVGRDNFNLKKLTVDISGIPDNRYLVRSDEILRIGVAEGRLGDEARKTATNETYKDSRQSPRGDVVEQRGAEGQGLSHAPSVLPILEAGDLKKITISPLKLREVLTGLERAFV